MRNRSSGVDQWIEKEFSPVDTAVWPAIAPGAENQASMYSGTVSA